MRPASEWAKHLDRGPFAWHGTLEQFVQCVQADALEEAIKIAQAQKRPSWDYCAGTAVDLVCNMLRSRIYNLATSEEEHGDD